MIVFYVVLILGILSQGCSFNLYSGSSSTASARSTKEKIEHSIKVKEKALINAKRLKITSEIERLTKEIDELKKRKKTQFFSYDSQGNY